jgi:tetratricopeptide (TPR) repeat protein
MAKKKRKAAGGSPDPPSQRFRAEELLHQAFEADEPADVVELARQALEIWPDCADAYVLLAEQARGPQEALDLYTKGVAAGERELGDDPFRHAAVHFWSRLQTRPYMRARYGLAQALWVLGRRAESVEHYQDMLRLNPADNQGVRYNLAACLIELGRDEELASLLTEYEGDVSTSWAYSAALLAYRREGDTPNSRRLLAAARKYNRHVADFLTGREMLPSRMPQSVGRGDRDEAVDYAVGFLNGWRATPGALAWLRRSSERKRVSPPKAKAGRGPSDAAKKRLKRLPQPLDAHWQAEARRLPVWMNVNGELRRPWIVLVVSKTDDLILGQEVIEGPPPPALLWDKLVEAMGTPAMGPPHRPAEIEVRPSGAWDVLGPHLGGIDVRLAVSDRLELVDDILEKLVEHVCGRSPGPALLEMPGMRVEQVASFFEAAAAFYRSAPWQRVGGAETVKISCDRFESGPWYAVVIGQMGMTLGVALYENHGALVRMRDGNLSDEQNARETVALSVTYGNETEIPVADLDSAERHGWEIAGPDAYPAPIRKERGLVMRPPLTWELRLLEATLRALPDFIATHDRNDPSPQDRTVSTGAGPLTLNLAWISEDPMD